MVFVVLSLAELYELFIKLLGKTESITDRAPAASGCKGQVLCLNSNCGISFSCDLEA